ncbi:phosphatidylserine/phosphatidylglycerophosphate/cardiolipin synthase-like enzyme [Thermosipho japonicus]|uniref:phospholipase D n=1 Tax=Thermosipho japonicus TaxID=90323 RepID=A0A841GSA5_9BACT|nr:phospholipase D-like domain-containing protein [Thermosipho japonicus]MBB6062468.1 phosphatidylserine/phosphatidylglycerophosphate/cardiolipin synthase-like enzyme [Thermosipho japonicus]
MKISSILIIFLSLVVFSANVYFTEFVDLTDVVVDFINNSNKFLYVSSYSLDNYYVVEAINRLSEKGLDVRVILEVSNKDLKCKVLKDYEKSLHHAKFMVNDNGVIFGSANFTDSGLFEGYNDIVVFEKDKVENFKNLFLNLWNDGRVSGCKNFFVVGYNDVESKLLEFIQSAKKRIYVCVYALTNKKVFALLKYKESRGIEVKIITDKWFDNSILKKYPIRNIVIVRDKMLHHKFVIVDNSVFLGSANITVNGLTKNFEMAYISKQFLSNYLKVFDYLWRRYGENKDIEN